jgi:transposase
MDNFDLFPNDQCEDIKLEQGGVRINLRSQSKSAHCPYCKVESNRRNGHYRRYPYDLPLGGKRVRLEVRVQRYFCSNENCIYKTFGEQFALVGRKAQRSSRLYQAHTNIALKLGGEAGSDLSGQLSMLISADTLLRDIKHKDLPMAETPRVLGIDDWAMKKRERYGTILVDLEKQKVVDLLEGRDSEILADWLKSHPGIEIITRDRSLDYAKAAKEAAPEAEQVADRWHLLQNLRQMLERWLKSIQKQLLQLPLNPSRQSKIASLFPTKPSLSRITKAVQESSKASLESKSELHKQVNALFESGMKQVHISKKLGIHRHTVRSYIQADEVPHHQRHARPTSILDPYLQYLEKHLAEGCENASQLWREIVNLGYSGKPWQVYKWLQPQRSRPSKHRPSKPKQKPQEESKPLTISFLPSMPQLAWLFYER